MTVALRAAREDDQTFQNAIEAIEWIGDAQSAAAFERIASCETCSLKQREIDANARARTKNAS